MIIILNFGLSNCHHLSRTLSLLLQLLTFDRAILFCVVLLLDQIPTAPLSVHPPHPLDPFFSYPAIPHPMNSLSGNDIL